MPYQATIESVRAVLIGVFAEVDAWFDRPAHLRSLRINAEGWSIDQILEHITLTNHFLMLIIRRWTEKAVRRAGTGERILEGESDLERLDVVGERGSFGWVRPAHMEPTGIPTSSEVRDRMRQQVGECIDFLRQLKHGEGSLCKVRMSVNGLGKIDLYQWLFFLAQHAQRHLQQMEAIAARHA